MAKGRHMRTILASQSWPATLITGLLTGVAAAQVPLGTGVTYQGQLKFGGGPFDGNAAMVFELWNAPAGGAQVGADDIEPVVTVTDGLFTVVLNDAGQYGPTAFAGDARWLQIFVNGNLLTPRQPVTAAPHALFSLTADLAADAGTLDGVNSTAFLRSNTSDQFTSGTLTINAGTTLDVAGTLNAVSLIDRDDAARFIDPSNTGVSANLAGSIAMLPGEGITVNGGSLTFGGSNLVLNLGDSVADQVFVPAGEFFIRSTEGNSSIFFFEDGLANGESFAWNDAGDNFTLSDDLSIAGAVSITGSVTAASFVDSANTGFFLDPASTGTSLDIAGSISMAVGESIATNGQLTIGGANLVLRLGDSTADQVALPAKEIFMSDTVTIADGDQNLFYTDGGVTTANFLRWDDTSTFACGGAVGNLNSVFDSHIADDLDAGWVFTTGATSTDAEVRWDDDGNFQADGTVVSSNACDLAEMFLGPATIQPGDILVLDPAQPEGVILSSRAYQSGIAGVVSTAPAFLMAGPTADAYPLLKQWRDFENAHSMSENERALSDELGQLSETEDDETGSIATRRAEVMDLLRQEWAAQAPIQAQAAQMEQQFDNWQRGNIPVALAGRVPVRVVGPVQPGDHLTTSDVPGAAMAMAANGPTIGIALNSHGGAGEGSVLVLIQPGWFGGFGDSGQMASAGTFSSEVAQLRNENTELRQRLDALESALQSSGLLPKGGSR